MKKRKHICLIIPNIIEMREVRLIEGIKSQCLKYDFDLSVFAIKEVLSYYEQVIKDSSSNIYNLINFSLFDGVIVDVLSFISDKDLIDRIFSRIKTDFNGPVVTISTKYEDYPVMQGKNDNIFREICRHMVKRHHYSRFYILTGSKDSTEGIQRLNTFKDELQKLGVSVGEDDIFYGDFWYSSGDELGKKIISGELEKPDAVICSSDHMGIGLINRLIKGGIRVPDDIAVIGYEGTLAAKMNPVSLTSFVSNDVEVAASAVDYLCERICPETEIVPYVTSIKSKLCKGISCGCSFDSADLVNEISPFIYQTETNFTDTESFVHSNIGVFLESHCYEELFSSSGIESCISSIANASFFVKPFESFYMCLTPEWFDISKDIHNGYPEKMKLVIKRNKDDTIPVMSSSNGVLFDTKDMLPDLNEERDEPAVFYYLAAYFNDVVFGYTVVKRNLNERPLDILFKNWLRFVCSSIEMTRAKNTYMMMSVRDSMTGLYNRRGMYQQFDSLVSNIKENESVYVAVIDMDGLKYINDTFGHKEGDFCIKNLSLFINSFFGGNEITVRAGGDEFYVIGVGEYTEEKCQKRNEQFISMLSQKGKFPDKDYTLSASIGSTLWQHENEIDIDELITRADELMYRFKVARKKNRT